MQSTCSKHFDRFEIALLRIERYKRFHLFEQYKEELEFQFVKIFYLNSLFIFLTRCNDMTPRIHQYMKNAVKELFPKYQENPYFLEKLAPLDLCLLKTIEMELSQDGLNALKRSIQRDFGMLIEKEKILMVKGISRYDALRIYIDELAVAFQRLGYECFVLDGSSPNFIEEFQQITKEHKFSFLFTCNGILLSQRMLSMIPMRFCTWLFDHPIHHMERLNTANAETVIFCCDELHVQYIHTYFPHLKHVYFLPSSGSYLSEHIPYEKRSIDLVFTGSNLLADTLMGQIMALPKAISNIALGMITILKMNSRLTIENALELYLEQHNLILECQDKKDLLFAVRNVDKYIRAYYREKVMQTIVEAGIRIHVFGTGWEQCEFSKRENFIQCEGYGSASLKAIANAKISLNVMPWFKGGFQERIATAMLSDTIALTDHSEYLDKNFRDNENIVFYSLDKIDQLPKIIQELIQRPIESSCIAREGYKTAKTSHTYMTRAKEIIKTLTEIKK